MEVLEQAARAQAAGTPLGDAKVIADLTTSAINAYTARPNLSAVEATDAINRGYTVGEIRTVHYGQCDRPRDTPHQRDER